MTHKRTLATMIAAAALLTSCTSPQPVSPYEYYQQRGEAPGTYNPYAEQAIIDLGNTYYRTRQQYLEENRRQRDRLYQSYDLMNQPPVRYGLGHTY